MRGRKSQSGGTRREREAHGDRADWDKLRRHSEGVWLGPQERVPRAPLPRRMRLSRGREPLCARGEDAEGHGHEQGAGVGHQSPRCLTSRREGRRATWTTSSSRWPSSSGPGSRKGEERQGEVIRKQREEQEAKEKEKEKERRTREGFRDRTEEERGEREAGWQASSECITKDGEESLWWDRFGSPGKGEEACESKGQEIPQQEDQEEFFDEHIKFEVPGKRQRLGGGPGVGALRGRDQGEGHQREIPRDTMPAGLSSHAAESLDRGWRGSGVVESSAHIPPLLPPAVAEEGNGSDFTGAPDNLQLFGPSGPWQAESMCRHTGTETEVNREHSSRQSLVRQPEDGGGDCRGDEHCSTAGVAGGTSRDLCRIKDEVLSQRTGWQERRWKREEQEGPGRPLGGGSRPQLQGKEEKGWRQEEGRGQERRLREDELLKSPGVVASGSISKREGFREIGSHGMSEDGMSDALGPFDRAGGESPVVRLGSTIGCSLEKTDKGSFQVFSDQAPKPPVVSLQDAGTSRPSEENMSRPLSGNMSQLGSKVLQYLLEVAPLRSQPMGSGGSLGVFPLPTSRQVLRGFDPSLNDDEISWMISVCIALNSSWGGVLFSDESVKKQQRPFLANLVKDVSRLRKVVTPLNDFNWDEFFRTRTVDYQGEEVRVARRFAWKNVAPALPREIGRVPLSDVCSLGAQFYVDHFDLFIKPREEWGKISQPKVMVSDADWGAVCQGLVDSGVCGFIERDEIFDAGEGPLLNGLFGVPKDEEVNGVEVYRLIMNLIPLNSICQPISGDVGTLPSWAMMAPLFLQPSEHLLVSSEDVRCFFYVMSVPSSWFKYLAFNKRVPPEVLPEGLRGREIYLCSKVLPMGFINSVSLAQHVHRNLVIAGESSSPGVAPPEGELRKDRPFPLKQDMWRVYLDNFDLLEKVKGSDVGSLIGSDAPGILALRNQYEVWDVPRNVKKHVSRASVAEVQGAQIDGQEGVAYPRDSKLAKYLTAALQLCATKHVSQRQMQVVCGGLVYVSMFRRPLLGGLNAVWRFIESFSKGKRYQALPDECRLEIVRFLALFPLARMDFRTPMNPRVSCSDASMQGGGVCISSGLSRIGNFASSGWLRGSVPENLRDFRILSIGLFDGVGALRVSLDLLGVEVLGHVSVEVNAAATRVVESHFPNVIIVKDVAEVTDQMVHGWSCRFSQASLVLLGAGPPCQGVSGLNASRRGALRDERSSLFFHVKRIGMSVKKHFVWCPTHMLMESVASMDVKDREVMSTDFGDSPWKCDAGTMTWCSRPRLYWLSWDLDDDDDDDNVVFKLDGDVREVCLYASLDLDEVCSEGWTKVDPHRPFPTFTTSRPRTTPGYKPAGVQHCTQEELNMWIGDSYRFPPYQYSSKNCMINRGDKLRVPNVAEREIMLGFPLGYTQFCLPKNQRKASDYGDVRLTLLGNTWSVPVVSWLVGQLFSFLGVGPRLSPQDIMARVHPKGDVNLQCRLQRMPLRPLRGSPSNQGDYDLAFKLSNLVSIKGEDIMVLGASQEQVKFHRLRASVPSNLWKWKVVTGWRWTGNSEHINVLEMRAILTALKWRIERKGLCRQRFIHLTDSLVCLHCLSRGRSSSRKLRRTVCRINALLLVSGCQPFWGYVHTDQNPADKPSRWGKRIRTKFRNA